MHSIFRITAVFLCVFIVACTPRDAATSPTEQVRLLKFDRQKMSFVYPKDGTVSYL